jgi:hypothetical protein
VFVDMAVRRENDRVFVGAAIALLASLLVVGSACGDPVRDEAIAALGPEGKVPPGPSHRPGQPCTLCHSEEGNAGAFSIAGTVYLDAVSDTPVGNVAVTIIDSKARSFTATTNCAGNFYVRPEKFDPAYPYWVTMDFGMIHRSMDTPSFREGSCGSCHSQRKGRASAAQVYLLDEGDMAPPTQCN